MAYSLTPGMPLGDAVVAVVSAEVDAALVSLARVHATADPDAVHDVRKRTKKLRAVALALRSSVSGAQWRAVYRSAGQVARALADSRDAQVRLGTLTALVADRQAEFADALAHASVLAQRAPPSAAMATVPPGANTKATSTPSAGWALTVDTPASRATAPATAATRAPQERVLVMKGTPCCCTDPEAGADSHSVPARTCRPSGSSPREAARTDRRPTQSMA